MLAEFRCPSAEKQNADETIGKFDEFKLSVKISENRQNFIFRTKND